MTTSKRANRQHQRRQLRRQFQKSDVYGDTMYAGRRKYGQGTIKGYRKNRQFKELSE